MTKQQRLEVYNKYDGHCAYCGKAIEYKDMQVDHIYPKSMDGEGVMDNYNPSCRRCNYYKDSMWIETYRNYIKKLHTRAVTTFACKAALDYGIITVKEWDGLFYFERVSEDG